MKQVNPEEFPMRHVPRSSLAAPRPTGAVVLALAALILAGCPDGQRQDPSAAGGSAAPVPAVAKGVAEASGSVPASAVSKEADRLPTLGDGAWVPVARGTVAAAHPAIGIFRARQTTKLGSQVNGRVLEVLVDVGDRVKAGQELVRLDPAFFRIEVAQKKADLDAAMVARADAELNFGRMKNLWDKPDGKEPSIPRKLFDDAKARLDSAVAHEAQARESLANAEERLKEAAIRAPYDGVVSRRMVDPGEPVTSAPVTELLEVREVERLDLEFSLPQELLAKVRQGTRVEYEVEGIRDGKGSGQVEVIFPALDEATRSFRCRLTVPNGEMKCRPGALVKVMLIVDEVKDALAVPLSALSRAGAGWEATVLANGRPERRAVEIGVRAAELVEVRSGLGEGEKVWVPRTTG
jgi:RND family efflux transporter MFP subunit